MKKELLFFSEMNVINKSPYYDSFMKGMAQQGYRIFILAYDGSENVLTGGNTLRLR